MKLVLWARALENSPASAGMRYHSVLLDATVGDGDDRPACEYCLGSVVKSEERRFMQTSHTWPRQRRPVQTRHAHVETAAMAGGHEGRWSFELVVLLVGLCAAGV